MWCRSCRNVFTNIVRSVGWISIHSKNRAISEGRCLLSDSSRRFTFLTSYQLWSLSVLAHCEIKAKCLMRTRLFDGYVKLAIVWIFSQQDSVRDISCCSSCCKGTEVGYFYPVESVGLEPLLVRCRRYRTSFCPEGILPFLCPHCFGVMWLLLPWVPSWGKGFHFVLYRLNYRTPSRP